MSYFFNRIIIRVPLIFFPTDILNKDEGNLRVLNKLFKKQLKSEQATRVWLIMLSRIHKKYKGRSQIAFNCQSELRSK